MNKLNFMLLFSILVAFIAMHSSSYAQSEPVMYFCEKYDSNDGEIAVGDRFHRGPVTVMVKSVEPLYLTNVSIQYDKYNFKTGKFDYYKSFVFDIQRDMSYIYFSPTSGNDMKFEDSGFYRVFLLDQDGNTITSAIIEIIP
jgi:hypothetical protein